jgi:hypothetical protein
MTTVQIFHAEPFNGGLEPPARYVHAADYAERFDPANEDHLYMALERAWRFTQNLHGSWSRGPTFEDGTPNHDHSEFVTVRQPLHQDGSGGTYGLRSSSMGDVFQVGDQLFRAVTIGFKPLTYAERAHFLEVSA